MKHIFVVYGILNEKGVEGNEKKSILIITLLFLIGCSSGLNNNKKNETLYERLLSEVGSNGFQIEEESDIVYREGQMNLEGQIISSLFAVEKKTNEKDERILISIIVQEYGGEVRNTTVLEKDRILVHLKGGENVHINNDSMFEEGYVIERVDGEVIWEDNWVVTTSMFFLKQGIGFYEEQLGLNIEDFGYDKMYLDIEVPEDFGSTTNEEVPDDNDYTSKIDERAHQVGEERIKEFLAEHKFFDNLRFDHSDGDFDIYVIYSDNGHPLEWYSINLRKMEIFDYMTDEKLN